LTGQPLLISAFQPGVAKAYNYSGSRSGGHPVLVLQSMEFSGASLCVANPGHVWAMDDLVRMPFAGIMAGVSFKSKIPNPKFPLG
jgi:hypothetical protein